MLTGSLKIFPQIFSDCIQFEIKIKIKMRVNDHEPGWFRERHWQNEADASSREKIFAVEYQLER